MAVGRMWDVALRMQGKELCPARGCPGTGQGCETLQFGGFWPIWSCSSPGPAGQASICTQPTPQQKNWSLSALGTSLNIQHWSLPGEELPINFLKDLTEAVQ